MTEGPERTTHTLSEILLDTRTTEEKVKGAAKSAPFWVIAIMGHLILVFIFGMVVLRHEIGQGSSRQHHRRAQERDCRTSKIEEKPEPEKEIERTAIPQVENTEVTEVTEQFSTATDDVVNPYAQENTKFGVSEGQEDAPDNLMTMSTRRQGPRGRHRSRCRIRSRRRRAQGQPARRLAHRTPQPAGRPAAGDREGRHGRPRVAAPPPEPRRQLGLRRVLVELRRQARSTVRRPRRRRRSTPASPVSRSSRSSAPASTASVRVRTSTRSATASST